MSNNSKNLVWIDLEFSGLNPDVDVILEIATIVTDSFLNIIAKGPEIVIHQSNEILANMDKWNTEHHGASGLTEKIKKSKETHESAERKTLEFIKQHCDYGKSPLCGNSIHQDRRYLYKYMPQLSEYLHYRNIDVSSVKELSSRWFPDTPLYKKEEKHRAMEDIIESIDEMKYFREKIFINV